MYEIIIVLLFTMILISNSMRIIQTFIFISFIIVYVMNDITIVDDLTLKISGLLCIIISCMMLMSNYYNEKEN